jgi:nucleotide-binding universal stress UspA family protein
MATRILVPLDGSDLAEQALPCAVMLARGLPADVDLFRAISISPDLDEVLGHTLHDVEAHMGQLEAEAKEYLRKVAGRLRKSGLGVRTVVRRGPASEAIVEYAEQMDMEYIVMFTHGYSGISRWRHGSVAERVLQSASVPVLMVCAKGGEGVSEAPMTCQQILVPLDGSERAEQVLPPATSIAQALDAKVVLFRVPIVQIPGVFTDGWYVNMESTYETADRIAEEYLSDVADKLQAQGVRVSTAIQMGSVAGAILEYAEANNVDLIAMCTHGRTGLARWALGSVADRVLRARSTPLLLVRAK